MQQLLLDTAHAARQRFKNKPIRIWYVKLGSRSWRCIVFNTASKVKLAEGPIRQTAKAAVLAAKNQLEAAVQKTS